MVSARPAGASWQDPVGLGRGSSFSLDIGLDPSGSPVVVWVVEHRRGLDLRYDVRLAHRALGKWRVQTVARYPGGAQPLDPQATVAPDGSVTLAWLLQGHRGSRLLVATGRAGAPWPGARQASTPRTFVDSFALATSATGDPQLTWIAESPTGTVPSGLFARSLAAAGWGEPWLLSSDFVARPRIVATSDGGLVAGWLTYERRGMRFHAATAGPDGAWRPSAVVGESARGGVDDFEIAATSAGGAIGVWSDRAGRVRSRYAGADGQWGATYEVARVGRSHWVFDVDAVATSGGLVAVWGDIAEPGDRSRLLASTLPTSTDPATPGPLPGATWSATTRLSPPRDDLYELHAASDPASELVTVGWLNRSQPARIQAATPIQSN